MQVDHDLMKIPTIVPAQRRSRTIPHLPAHGIMICISFFGENLHERTKKRTLPSACTLSEMYEFLSSARPHANRGTPTMNTQKTKNVQRLTHYV